MSQFSLARFPGLLTLATCLEAEPCLPVSMTTVSANDPRIAIMGRTAPVDDGIRLGYPGIRIRFRYSGPAPTILLSAASENGWFNLACHDWDPVVVQLLQGANELHLPAGPAPAEGWQVELVRRTESWQGTVDFVGLKLGPETRLLDPLPPTERKLIFIGDSITCGAAIDRFPMVFDQTARSSNAARAFSMLAGQYLDAQIHIVGYGGRGVVRDWEGRMDNANGPQFFQLALPDDPQSLWDHSRFTPDAIVVCFGPNDFNQGLIDHESYTSSWTAFVRDIRTAHPDALIFLAESPMFGYDPDGLARRNRLRASLDATVLDCGRRGDTHVSVIPVGYFPGTRDNSHPVAFQHEQIALQMVEAIKKVTGW